MLTATPPAEARSSTQGRVARWRTRAERPVAAESVAVFRISFGLLATYSALRFLARGWVDTLYLEPEHHLTYWFAEWVRPWPAPFMHLHVVGLALLGLAIAAGYRHRLATSLFVAGFAYVELIDAALYLNHYWYVTLAGFLLALLPVHHRWSLDARSGRVTPADAVPTFVVWSLRAQLAAVYVFAGIAKLNGDWLWRAQPLRLWLADRTDLPLIGGVLDEPVVAYAASWSGALFDLTIVGWLLWRRSRPFAYVAVIGFHLVTGWLFQIGVFPWVMILGTLVFFAPDWPTRLIARVIARSTRSRSKASTVSEPAPPEELAPVSVGLRCGLVVFALLQLALPLRHYAHDGNVRWNEAGGYAAWRVMLTEKAGFMQLWATNLDTGERWEVAPSLVLTDWQLEQAVTRPDLTRRTAELVIDHYARTGTAVEVRFVSSVSMNGRAAAVLVDETVR